MNITLCHLTGIDAFTAVSDQWDALVAQSMTNTPFQRFAYQKAWAEHLAPGDIHIITATNDAGQLIGIAPFYIIDGTIHFNGCIEESDYLDLICTTADAPAFWEAVITALNESLFPEWHTLDLCNIPADSPSRTILPNLAEKLGFQFTTNQLEVCPTINLPDQFSTYLSSLDKRQRHEINRKLRRARNDDEHQIVIRTITAEDDLDEAMAHFFTLLQKSTAAKNAWLNDGRRALFRATAAAALADGILNLWFLTVDGEYAATLFNFDYNNRIWVYNSGLDPDAFGWLGAGIVLSAQAIETAVENGRSHFDFLRGDEAYKYRFGAVDAPIFQICLTKDQS